MQIGTKSFWIFAPLSVIASAVIAYGLVFWTPWFGARGDFGYGTYYDTSYDYSYPMDMRELAKRQPEQVQIIVRYLWDDIVSRSEADLYVVKSLPDVCLGTIECRGIPSNEVKPFIEAALAHKQARETASIASRGTETSQQSLVVSIFALIISAAGWIVGFLTYRRGKEDSAVRPLASRNNSSPPQ